MKINVHAGHNFHVMGAGGQFSETKEDRNVKNKLIALLKAEGHTVYDCTDEDGRTQNANLANIVKKCNAHSVDLDVSIHFNAYNGTAHGTEVWVLNGSSQRDRAKRICDKISALGFDDRGVKSTNSLYVLRNTKAPALLVECCFCDSAKDAKLYNAETMARAIAEGILNKKISHSTERYYGKAVDNLNVRSRPDKTSRVVKTMAAGDQFEIIGETPKWYKIDGGYVAKSRCAYRVKTTDELNIRNTPTAKGKIIDKLDKGAHTWIKSEENTWGLRVNGGYIKLSYTSKD